MHLRVEVPLLAALVATAGCTVGSGAGSAAGPIWVVGCLEGDDYGSPSAPREFNLNPTFFAGEPIEDIADGPKINRLVIRMQRNGNGIEINDTLYFDIPDSGRVARCLRGRVDAAGVTDYDTGPGTIATPTNPDTSDDPPWCDWSAGGSFPRIRVFPEGPVRAAFAPLRTCGSEARPPAFVNTTGDAETGWIEFEYFGNAEQPQLPPDMRTPIGDDFKVGFGQRLRATFNLQLEDHRVIVAIREDDLVPQDARIGGMLEGYFDFELERGRAAQTFP
jgi:hypothetical protein